MTTTSSTTPAEATVPRDLRHTWRLLAAIVIPLGPLGVLLTRGLMPYWTSQDEETVVATMVAEPGRAEAMTWVFFVTFPALVLGALAVGYVARRGAPRLATWGAGLTFVAFVMAGSFGSTDLLMHVMGREGYDQATIVDVTGLMFAHPVNAVGGGVFVVGHIVGMILLGIAVARARVVPLWAGVAIAVSQPFHLVSAVIVPSRLMDLTLGWGLTTIGFAMVALAVLRTPDDAWDLPPAR